MTQKNTDQNISRRLDQLESQEARIEAEETKILETDLHILEEIEKNKNNSQFASKLYRYRFGVSILLTIGIALVWRAIGDISKEIPFISSAIGALVVGFLILLAIDRLTKNQ